MWKKQIGLKGSPLSPVAEWSGILRIISVWVNQLGYTRGLTLDKLDTAQILTDKVYSANKEAKFCLL